MKKIILVLILSLFVARPCFAQNNLEAMRFLTINSLMQYGQKLYERGDFDEACAVFNRVLAYDRHQAQALNYIKEMGRLTPPSSSQIALPVVDVADTQSLREAIEAKKQVIEQLRSQITQLRENLTVQSTE